MATDAVLLGTAALLLSLLPTYSSPAAPDGPEGAGRVPAYLDGRMLTVDLREDPAGPRTAAPRAPIRHIYLCGSCDGFAAVLDAGDPPGRSPEPLWREMQLVFNPGHPPRQLVSDRDVLRAAAGAEITLHPTGGEYHCRVVPD